jgi:hypothetical protein
VRQPADGLRCVVECVEIVLLLGIGLLARATVADVETNIVGASQLANRKLLAGILACSASSLTWPCSSSPWR